MKVRDLIKELKDYEDFDVTANITERDGSDWGLSLKSFEVDGVGDIGYSDKKIILALEEDK